MIGVVLYGQLGNQMFQYAAARSLADSLNTTVASVGPQSSWRRTLAQLWPSGDPTKYPDAGRDNGKLRKSFGYGGSHLNLRMSGQVRTLVDHVLFDQVYEAEFETTESGAFVERFNADFYSLPDRTLLSGWLQSSKYWKSDRKFAQDLYSPSEKVIELRKNLESETGIYFDNAIALHVRRSDYLAMRHGLSESDTGWTLPKSYYSAALRNFPDDQAVLVFSDDPDWAKQNFTEPRFLVQPMRAAEDDLFLLSMCKDKIIANSSFSWWAAYLGEQPDGVTIAPKYHLGWRLNSWVPEDISQPSWKYLNVTDIEQKDLADKNQFFVKKADAAARESSRSDEASASYPPVSVLIPCFNAERWVGQAIESALSQKAKVEVIVYDDGSTDKSLEIAESFGDRIKLIGGDNKGAPTARNALLEHASHEWLQYLDADDYLLSDKISQQLEYVSAHPDVDVFYGPVWIEWRDRNWSRGDAELDRSPIPEPHDPWRQLALWHLPQTGGPLWRKAAIVDAGGWTVDQPCCQEHELYLRLLKHKKRFFYTPSGGAVYRRFEEGTVSTNNMRRVRSERSKIEHEIEAYLAANDELTADRKWAVNQARFEMARNAWPDDRSEARSLHAPISRSMSDFLPGGSAAPRHYQRLYSLFGFEFTENVAALSRQLSGMFRK